MSDGDNSGDGASPSHEERKKESRLLARTRNAGKQAVVFEDDDDEGGAVVATALHAGPLAKTWSPGADSSAYDLARSPAGGAWADGSLMSDTALEHVRDPDEEQAAAKSRAERIARRAAALQEIEERNITHSQDQQGGGFGRTFGGDYGEENTGQNDPAKAGVRKHGAAAGDKVAISKLDHRSVLGNRDSTVDGLLDFGIQRKKLRGDARDGLDLDAGSMKRRGLAPSPRGQKVNRTRKQLENAVTKPRLGGDGDGTQVGAATSGDEELDGSPQAEMSNEGATAPEEGGAGGDEEEELNIGDEDGPLGAMLQGMAKNLSNYGDRKELERELQALKAALAGDEGASRDSDDESGAGERAAAREARNQEGAHRSPVGKVTAPVWARGGERASHKVVRDDISSSDDDSGDGEIVQTRGPVERRPHVYQAAGLQRQAGPVRRSAEFAQEKGQRGLGSDDEGDMRPLTPPQAPATAETDATVEDLVVGAANFVGSKTWSPDRGVSEVAGIEAAHVDRFCLCLRPPPSPFPHTHTLSRLYRYVCFCRMPVCHGRPRVQKLHQAIQQARLSLTPCVLQT